jgi:hypothetical protein
MGLNFDSPLSTAINQSFRGKSCFLSDRNEANLTIIQIMQQERSFLRRVFLGPIYESVRSVCLRFILTLSKPVDPLLTKKFEFANVFNFN